MKRLFVLVLVLMTGLLGFPQEKYASQVRVPLSFDFYYTYDMVVDALQKLHNAYPELTVLEKAGKSEEGRIIYCMTVNNPETGVPLSKPGIYVDGNIHGNEIQAGEVCLYLLNTLLTQYESNEEIKKLVDTRCFYVVPSVNVDGRYHFFKDANTSSSNRGLRRPKDDDNDGLKDEDFPDDLDGDGNICQMRIKDPFGDFKTDPEDERLMIQVNPGEKGEWSMLGSEGIDNDGDGKINEDSEGYVDPNRNWGFDWQPNYVQRGSGDFPFSGKGLKDLSEFIHARVNICMAWAFHNSGGMFLRGPSAKSQKEYPQGDIKVYDYLGEHAERMAPGYKYMISWKDLYETHGDFGEWMAMKQGTYVFVGELFNRSSAETYVRNDKKNEESSREDANRERLKFNDNLAQGELYKPWTPFKHPVYGNIEIGGWVKMSSRLPAPFMLKDLVHRNAMAVIFSAKQAPNVTMDIFDIKKLDKKQYQVRVRLSNSNAIPSMSYQAEQVKLYPKDTLTLSGDAARAVAGGQLTDLYRNQVRYKDYRPEVQFLKVPGFSKVDYQFIVEGKGDITVTYYSRHAGTIQKKVSLN